MGGDFKSRELAVCSLAYPQSTWLWTIPKEVVALLHLLLSHITFKTTGQRLVPHNNSYDTKRSHQPQGLEHGERYPVLDKQAQVQANTHEENYREERVTGMSSLLATEAEFSGCSHENNGGNLHYMPSCREIQTCIWPVIRCGVYISKVQRTPDHT